mmetsp:Transcript_17114/g.39096  ORF Transcript_17114/g.39096 Transcript_17114/m.39096 type:complete len:223 (-) Transcript_17114:46-714(-)
MTNITVGCRPHRNPSRNGIQILFYENILDEKTHVWRQQKIGFLLMKNNLGERTSSMLGMFLKPTRRGRGTSKLCLAAWIWLCLKGSMRPVTGIIHKPLLALILEHTFGFEGGTTRNNDGGSGNLVELSQDPDDPRYVQLYSPSGKSLEGALSPSDLRHQNIRIVSQKPAVRGRVIRIGSRFCPPRGESQLQAICDRILSEESWRCGLPSEEVRLVFFGKSVE